MRGFARALGILLAISLIAMPLRADQSVSMKRAVAAPQYDVSKEVTLEGTVESLVKKPAPGTLAGVHLIVSTQKGTVDAHIGNLVTSGRSAASFAPGQAVKLVGMMIEVGHQDVLIVRTIQTGGRTITVRSDHGFLVPPGSRAAQIAEGSSTGGGR